MSRLEEIKQELRSSGLPLEERHIDWLAREKHRHEKMKNLHNSIQTKIKNQLKLGKNAS